MASGGVYEEDDNVDDYLLNQVSKHILYNKLGNLARDLRLCDVEYSRIAAPTKHPEEQIFGVLRTWQNKGRHNVKQMVAEITTWCGEGYVCDEIWDRLRTQINPVLLPEQPTAAPSGDQNLPELGRKLRNTNIDLSANCEHVGSSRELPLSKRCAPTPSGDKTTSSSIDCQGNTKPSATPVNLKCLEDYVIPSEEEVAWIRKLTERSLYKAWKNCMSHDWLPRHVAGSFPLKQFYVGLRWAKRVRRAMRSDDMQLTSIFDILTMVDCDDEMPTNILVRAEPGMGKTCSMALLALDWLDKRDSKEETKRFDLVFLLQLRYANKTSSLPELITAQHDKLDANHTAHLKSILDGKTRHRVLLILDGYDEYTPGTNRAIDDAIESGIGNCFLILTSRPGNYVSKRIRNKMDGEVIIEGFSKESIVKCATLYLDSAEKSSEMLQQAAETGIDVLLHVPIILLMVCVVFDERQSLPKSKTGIVQILYELAMDRSTMKAFGCKSSDLRDLEGLLYTLGEFAWKALQKEIQQLLLNIKE